MGGNWKRQVRRTAAWAAALVLAVSSVCYGAEGAGTARETVWYPPKEHADVDFSQMAMEPYQLSDMDGAVERLAQATAAEGQEEAVLQRYEELLREVDRMETATCLADIAYSRDMSDPAVSGEMERLRALYPEATDRAVAGIQAALNSSYGPLLEEEMGKDMAVSIRHYEKLDAGLLALYEREQSLIAEYDQASARDYEVQVDGETWTYERLENEEDPFSDQYREARLALNRERNRTVGEIYLQLVRVRVEIAAEYGYDNYADYAYSNVYGRDFTTGDMARIRGDIKEIMVPLMEEVWYADVDYSPLNDLKPKSGEAILDVMEPYLGEISGELEEAFRYMRLHGLYDIQPSGDGENRSGGFTTGLPFYGDSYLFITQEEDYTDYLSVFHEFGHFASVYYDPTPSLFQNGYVDVSEIQSQGMQMLLMTFSDDMFGAAGEAMEAEAMADLLDSIIAGAMMDEFETAVYAEPDMTLEDLNRLFRNLANDYNIWYFDFDGNACYDWDTVPHLFHSPLYYTSYCTSAFPALKLWLDIPYNWDGAVRQYMSLSAMGTQLPYRKALKECGMGDIFEENALAELDSRVREKMGLSVEDAPLEPGADGMQAPENSGDAQNLQTGISVLILCGIGLVAVLQLLILCVGFVIIWLLVKDKNRR